MKRKVTCASCGSNDVRLNGFSYSARGRIQRLMCRGCGRTFAGLNLDYARERVGYLDIETSALAADFGHVISWAIKKQGSKGKVLYAIMRERSPEEEKRILRELLDALKQFDRVITYNGTMFDIPFLRTRCIYHGLPFPTYMQLLHTDLYYAAKGRLRTHRKRLETVAEFFGIPGKTPVKTRVWKAADWGQQWAFDYILRHNIGDVKVLERVHKVLDPYIKLTRRSI